MIRLKICNSTHLPTTAISSRTCVCLAHRKNYLKKSLWWCPELLESPMSVIVSLPFFMYFGSPWWLLETVTTYNIPKAPDSGCSQQMLLTHGGETLDIKLSCPHTHICVHAPVHVYMHACACVQTYTQTELKKKKVRMSCPEKQLGVQTRLADTNSQ